MRAWLRKLSSPMQRAAWSSHIITCSRSGHVGRREHEGRVSMRRRAGGWIAPPLMRTQTQLFLTDRGVPGLARTLLGGYRGDGPPPTMAMMLVRNSISTMPMPPLLNSRRICRDD